MTLERLSLSVLDGTKRIALAERRTAGDDGSPDLLVRYQFGNHIGSATLELDADGTVISYEEYHPYGSTSYQAVDKALRAVAKRYRFTGMERDESTGLEYHSARYYAPWLGRWTASDPAGLVDGTNPYRYCAGSPIGARDLSGCAANDVSEEVTVEAEANGPSKPRGFWDTGAGKALAFAGGAAVGFGVGVASAFIMGLLLPEIVVVGLGVALLGVGIAAAVTHRRELANRASRIVSGEASAEEFYEAGEAVGGLASMGAGGGAVRAGATVRTVAGRVISDIVESSMAELPAGYPITIGGDPSSPMMVRGAWSYVNTPSRYVYTLFEDPASIVQDPLQLMPRGARIEPWRQDIGQVTEGIKYQWSLPLRSPADAEPGARGPTMRLRVHGADPNPDLPPDANAAVGPIYRLQMGTRYLDYEGNLYSRGIENPNSIHYNPDAINRTHIPWPEDLPLPYRTAAAPRPGWYLYPQAPPVW